ncbi:hypothetical protein ACXR2T_10025 [Leucobacter sp. HY1910]
MFGRKRQQRGAKQAGVSVGGRFAATQKTEASGAGLSLPPRPEVVSGPGGIGLGDSASLSAPQHEWVRSVHAAPDHSDAGEREASRFAPPASPVARHDQAGPAQIQPYAKGQAAPFAQAAPVTRSRFAPPGPR